MEAELTTKKRKRPSSSNPFIGTFTRSKSQIFFHRNRSGRFIPDSSRNPFNLTSGKPRISEPKQESADNDDEDLGILIKDLRTRRVFSPVADECCLNRCEKMGIEKLGIELGCEVKNVADSEFNLSSIETKDCCDKPIDSKATKNEDVEESNRGFSYEGPNLEEKEEIEKYDNGYSCGTLNLDDVSPKLPNTGQRDNNVDETFDRTDDVNEEFVQATPPDAEIFGNSEEIGEVSGKPLKESEQKISEGIGVGFHANIDKRSESNSKKKLVLNSAFRRKLFKSRGSFTYKRLLPYLMDLENEDSCGQKTEKGFMGKSFQPLLASQCQDNSITEFKTDSYLTKHRSIDSGAPHGDGLSSGNNLNSTTLEHISESEMPFDSQKDLCITPTSMVDEKCLKVPMNGATENETGFSSEQRSSISSIPDLSSIREDSCLKNHDEIAVYSDYTRLEDNGCTELTDRGLSYGAENGNNMDSLSSIMKCHSEKVHAVDRYSDDTKLPEAGMIEKLDIDYPCKAQIPDHVNSSLSDTEGVTKLCVAEQRGDDAGEVVNQSDDSNGECVRMTPDAHFVGKPDKDGNGCNKVECALQMKDNVLGKPLSGKTHRNDYRDGDKRNISNSKSKLVLNPCSQLKVFRSPGLFSYRRLLPFLTQITNDTTSNDHRPNAQDSGILPMSTSAASFTSCDDKGNMTSPEHSIEPLKSFDSQNEPEFQVDQVVSDTDMKLDASPGIASIIQGSNPPAVSSCSSVSPESLSREGDKLVSLQLSADTEEDCKRSAIKFADSAKPIEADSLGQNTSQLEVSFALGTSSFGSKKGILKRNPRGCRGLCGCLNCTSFRLHAGRAFEFSRNQMQDAEEVALDLIKELSYLRKVLEEFADSDNGYAVPQVYQVKEACKKASEAEELAKSRLSQMNYDLNVHCRITCLHPPRVRFADYVEEKVIPVANLPKK